MHVMYRTSFRPFSQLFLVSVQQQPLHPTAGWEALLPLIVEMYRKHFGKFVVETTALHARESISPVSIARIWLEWVWKAIVEATRSAIREAEGKDLEGGDTLCHEPTPQTEVEDRTPIRRRRTRWCGRCHKVESLTEVGRVLMKMHQRAVECQVGFVWRAVSVPRSTFWGKNNGSIP